MTNVLNFTEKNRIQEDASRWLIRIDCGALTDEEAEAFSEWLHESLHHRDAIVELCRLWDSMEVISELSVLFPNADMKPPQTEPAYSILKKPVFIFNIVAATILTVLIVFFQYQPGLTESAGVNYQQQEIIYRTALGERREVLFEDGSVANMNTNSLLAVNFTDKQRSIQLLKGEAYFQVAHESDRPFLVYSERGLVRAVGTAFSVRMKGQKLEVIVTEGRVEIASVTPDESVMANEIKPNQFLAVLDAGYTAEFDNDVVELIKTIDLESISRKLSWQNDMLEFKGESLDEVITEINRYTDKTIVIADAKIRNIRIGGYFKTGEIEALLAVLESGFPIEIQRVDTKTIYLTGTKTNDN